jgi:hypothetical protein
MEVDRCNNLKMETYPPVKGTHFEMRQDQMYEFDESYVGINRVVYGPGSRVGVGLCEVCVVFDSAYCSGYGPGYQYCSCSASTP